jgi:endonuclease III
MPPPTRPLRPPPNLESVSALLSERYQDHDHYNRKNPLEELLFILCSVKTSERSYRRVYRGFRREFPTFSQLAEAPAEYLAKPLVSGGLYRQKSVALRKTMDAIIARFGKLTLAPLKHYEDGECEAFLTSLPGVGLKVARCVMMYSLGRDVFPVDTHCWRIARRLGWIRRTTKDGTCSDRDMDRLQARIPEQHRFALHVNFVSFGREICTALNPKCGTCPLRKQCPRIGVTRPTPGLAKRSKNGKPKQI